MGFMSLWNRYFNKNKIPNHIVKILKKKYKNNDGDVYYVSIVKREKPIPPAVLSSNSKKHIEKRDGYGNIWL